MSSETRTRVFPRRAVLTQAVPYAGGLALLWIMWRRADMLEMGTLLRDVAAVAPWQWALALAFTTLSYVAVGRYDRAVHGWLGTGIAPGSAEASGRAAIAVSQMTGMGLVTGTLLRWYILPELSLARAAALTAAVGSTFLAGLAVLAAALGLATGLLTGVLALAAGAVLAAGLLLVLAVILPPTRGIARRLPPLPRIGTVMGLAAMDLVAASAVFATLLGSADPQVLAAAVLSIGAGFLSATPAGVGGFEAGLATLLPGHDLGQLMAAALAFHIAYFAVPAIVAIAAILLRPAPFRRNALPGPQAVPGDCPTILAQAAAAPSAEAGLVAQPGTLALTLPGGTLAACLRRGRSTELAFAAPRGDAPLEALAALAGASGRAALAYKIAPRDALRARRMGWTVRLVGREAWLTPATFTVDGPAHRQLRRKLRHAEKAGITVDTLDGPLPWAVLDEIDAAWRAAHGAARGASMGRLDRQATARQIVLLARQNGNPVAYVSLHATPHERTLDLMRARPGLPDGTMHKLIVQATRDAADAAIPRLSLAAVPEQKLPARLAARFETATGAKGLRQFKAAFGPNWTPLYAAAPTSAGLALGLSDMAREIAS